ncbi:kynureninase [Jannaschia aquimarina]|uniref:Kynureninase n=1 Tax=Jannaschia aquimarina TaxID=935700 RepID=A0A0D1CPV7_9RHOB|nr:kynureninase [Jannaschia aquimarina]KIT16782.1 Kynureninase [Jannaschia aquimarina]SNS52486.1 Kynureninase [Jannaschia aquimarina]
MEICRKHLFELPDGLIYMDGNSLGPLPRAVPEAVAHVVRGEWGAHLIGGWNADGWMDQPRHVGDLIAPLIGAPAGSVTMGDTLSIKVHQALSAALEMRPDRRLILSDEGNFPTDLYMAQGLIRQLGKGHELRLVPPDAVEAAIDETVAAVMLTQVDYRTGRMHDMARLTRAAQAAGAVTIWDLAHSAGAVPVDVAGCGAEFAIGCTYKYLNGGPGAPAFIHVRPDLADTIRPALAGWLGHAAPFDFDPAYRPAPGVARMRVGTPPVLQMTALQVAMAVWDGVEMGALRDRSVALSERFIAGVEATCPGLTLASPREAAQRGSQVSFRFEHGYAAMQALIARGVVGDFRAPDIMRFGITPLYLDESDVDRAIAVLADVMERRLWDDPVHRRRQAVT